MVEVLYLRLSLFLIIPSTDFTSIYTFIQVVAQVPEDDQYENHSWSESSLIQVKHPQLTFVTQWL